MEVLYYNTIKKFVEDVDQDLFMNKMIETSKSFYWRHGESEKNSWQNNAIYLSALFEDLNIPHDCGIAFECAIPGGGSVDCMLFGQGENGKRNIVHIELKQWTNAGVFKEENSEVIKTLGYEVQAFTGGANRIVAHPSQQAKNYHYHMLNMLKIFDDNDYQLHGCAYCYNYEKGGALFDKIYEPLMKEFPLYAGNQNTELANFLKPLLAKGKGTEIFEAVKNSEVAPTKKLSQVVANMFKGNTEYYLLDEQQAACDAIFDAIVKARDKNKKSVILVKGGPGTGKTLIAFHVLSKLAATGKHTKSFFTTRSKALRTDSQINLKNVKIDGNNYNAADLVQNIYSFRPYNYKENEVDVLLVDEAHRTCEKGNFMADKNEEYTYLTQTTALLYCAKVVVFFIDDKQAIDSKEVGTSENLKNTAINYSQLFKSQFDQFYQEEVLKAEKKLPIYKEKLQQFEIEHLEPYSNEEKVVHKRLYDNVRKAERDIKCAQKPIISTYNQEIDIQEIELTTQFRCNGSNNYMQWLDEVLYSPQNVGYSLNREEYEFDVFDSPQELYDRIVSLNAPTDSPKQIARIAAGYCWTWTKKPLKNGDLAKDVVIGDFAMPWETNEGRARGEFKEMYASSADTWIKEKAGINQVGCIFSAQGFEVDYMGVIIGEDLDFDSYNNSFKIDPSKNKVRSAEDMHILNAYRILMTRGQKGTFVYCVNPAVRDYLKQMMNR